MLTGFGLFWEKVQAFLIGDTPELFVPVVAMVAASLLPRNRHVATVVVLPVIAVVFLVAASIESRQALRVSPGVHRETEVWVTAARATVDPCERTGQQIGSGLEPTHKGGSMLAYTYPFLDFLWTMVEIFLFIIWIWLAIMVFVDIFRSHDMGGLAKALWVLFIIILPFIGILVYLIARGNGMHQRAADQAAREQQAFNSYIQQTVGSSGSADELTKLADLKEKGVITEAEFDAQKAKILA